MSSFIAVAAIFIQFFLATSISFAGPRSLTGGNEGPSGGDTYAIEFESLARELHKTFVENPQSKVIEKWNFDPKLFINTVNEAVIRTQENVFLEGNEVDAIKFPDYQQKLILLSQSRWREKNLLDKLKIVTHEYFGLMKLEKNDSMVSYEFFDLIVKTYNRINNSPSFPMVNLFYGYKTIDASISQIQVCDVESLAFQKGFQEAIESSLSKCNLHHKQCDYETVVQPVVSTKYIGYRYCRITVTSGAR